jgi:hypothetical protein
MKKVYISGPMSGLPENNYPAFDARADELRRQGYRVVNPASIGRALAHRHEDLGLEPPTWMDHIIEDLRFLAVCDAITLLPRWAGSRGAVIESFFATHTGKVVI